MYYLVYMSLTSVKMPLMMLVPGYQYQLRFCVHQFSNVWFLHIYSTSPSAVHDYPRKWLRPFGEELQGGFTCSGAGSFLLGVTSRSVGPRSEKWLRSGNLAKDSDFLFGTAALSLLIIHP